MRCRRAVLKAESTESESNADEEQTKGEEALDYLAIHPPPNPCTKLGAWRRAHGQQAGLS
jgi:hypothetical protein